MTRLLIVHHTPSPNLQTLLESVVDGATTEEITGVEVVRKPALAATPSDVLEADAYLIGTTANLGYMAGATKHFFDQIYYPCLDATKGRPYSYYVHGGSDVSGTTRGIERIVTGLAWEKAAEPVTVTGDVSKEDREACWNLGATLAASVME